MAAIKVKQWKNTNYYGKAVTVKKAGGKVYLFNKENVFTAISSFATVNAVVGIASGKAVEMTNAITYYLVTLKTPINGNQFAYVSIQDFYFLTPKPTNEAQAKKDAQSLLDKLIESDKKLYKQTLTSAALLGQLQAKGVNVDAQKAKLTEILASIKRRQEAIKSNPFIKITGEFNLSGIGCDCEKIGFIPLIIIGAGVVVGGFVVYYFLKPEYNTSQLHSEYLTKNEAELKAKLGDKAYNELKKNVDQEIKDNAQDAYGEGKGEGFMSILKPLLLIGLGIFAMNKFQKSSKAA